MRRGHGVTGRLVAPALVIAACAFGGAVLTAAGLAPPSTASAATPPGVVPVDPARVVETRVGAEFVTVDHVLEGGGVRGAGSVLEVPVLGRGGVPGSGVGAVFLNVTAVRPAGGGFLTVYPCGSPRPQASNVNYVAGDVVPNAVLAKVGVGGSVCVYTLAATHLVVDVAGYTTTTVVAPSPGDVALDFLSSQLPAAVDPHVVDVLPGATGDDLVVVQYLLGNVPVLGAQAVMGVEGAQVTMSNSRPPLDLDVPTTPTVAPGAAATTARARVAATVPTPIGGLISGTPTLVVLDPALLALDQPVSARLTWQVSVTGAPAVAWDVFVDALDGSVLWAYETDAAALDRRICRSTENVVCTSPNRSEGDPAVGDAEVDLAYTYVGDADAYFRSTFGRDSWDGRGSPLPVTVGVNMANAQAFPEGNLRFGTGFVTDDVVAHEFTHLVLDTIPSGGLLGGALAPRTIHEGLADVFGELVDLQNGHGDDAASKRWLIGEEVADARFPRSAKQPSAENRAARVGDARWVWSGSANAAYIDMGVVTRLGYLMVDGNGSSIQGLGEEKAAQVLYAAAQTLTRSANVGELARQISWACRSFAMSGAHGVTAANCVSVDYALLDVGLAVSPPSHALTSQDYIARDPSTGRSLLVSGGTTRIIGSGELFNCLAASRVVWDMPELVSYLQLQGVWDVQLSCFDAGPHWINAPQAAGGNIPPGVILRNNANPGNNWLINDAGEIQTIATGGDYLCLAHTHPVIWNVPDAAITAWQPVGTSPALCDPPPITVGPLNIRGYRVWEPIDVQLTAEGGTAPYQWSLVSPTYLGLSVSSQGRLTGTPTSAGRRALVLKVTDALGVTADLNVNLDIGYGTAPPIAGQSKRLTTGDSSSNVVALSGDGLRLLIRSWATNLTNDPMFPDSLENLFVIDTTSGEIVRVTTTDVGYLTGYQMPSASNIVFYSTSTNSSGSHVYRWNGANRQTTELTQMQGGRVMSVDSTGSRLAWSRYEGGQQRLYVTDFASGTTVELSTDAGLVYSDNVVLSRDGRSAAYVAKPSGTNLVPYMHVATLSTPPAAITVVADRQYTKQSTRVQSFSADGSALSFETYHGFYNGGQGLLTVSNGSWREIGSAAPGGGVYNDVFDGQFAPSGNCMLVASYNPDGLTSDLPNRGRTYYYDDLFTYQVSSGSYRRITNTYADDAGGGVVSDACSVVAFSASEYAVQPLGDPADWTGVFQDIYVTVLPPTP